MPGSNTPLRSPGRPSFDQADKAAADRFKRACRHIALSKSLKLPLWRQLSEQLNAVINSGGLQAHSRIPSEEALADLFGVSRPVVRNALQSLAARGLIVKVHRKGIFVGAPLLEGDFVTTNISAYDMIDRGHRVSSQTFQFVRTSPDDQEREALQLEADGTVIRIERVFWMDGAPISYALTSLHGEKSPGFESLDIEDRPVLGLLRDRFDRRITRAERWFKAANPPRDVAEKLQVSADLPMIWIESIGYEADNTPLEYYRAYYNSDVARIHLSIMD